MQAAFAELERTGSPAQVVEAATHVARLLAWRDRAASEALLDRVRALAQASGSVWVFELAASGLARSRGAIGEAQRCAERALAAAVGARQEARALGELGESRVESRLPGRGAGAGAPGVGAARGRRRSAGHRRCPLALRRVLPGAGAVRRGGGRVPAGAGAGAPIDPRWERGTVSNLAILALEAGAPGPRAP